jgi:hypothetical protein
VIMMRIGAEYPVMSLSGRIRHRDVWSAAIYTRQRKNETKYNTSAVNPGMTPAIKCA